MRYTLTHLLEYLKLKRVTIPSAGEDVEHTQHRNVKLYNHFGSFLKVKHKLPYDPVIPLLDIYLREIRVFVQTKIVHNFHISSICNSQQLETTQISMSRWVDIQTVEHSCNVSLLSPKRNNH